MKKILLIILVIIVLSILGCNGDFYTPKEDVEFHEGREGIVMNTLSGMPPDVVFEKSEFVVGVELKNKGAYDVTDGVIGIVGLDPKYTAFVDKDQELVNIPGKSAAYPEGGYEAVHFKLKNIWFPTGKEEQRIPFTIIADYDYVTEGKVEICINPQVYSYIKTKETKCETKKMSISSGQGAPVAITSIEPSLSLVNNGEQIDLLLGIYIENEGNGNIIGDLVVEDAYLGNARIKCSNARVEGDYKEKNKWYVACSARLTNPREAYISPLVATFKYRYRELLNEEVSIKSLKDEEFAQ